MRKVLSFFFFLIAAFSAVSAWADPEALPAGAKLTCTANSDGTGTLSVVGVEVKYVELYVHVPVSKKDVLAPASSYRIPSASTFNLVFKNRAGEDRYVLVGGEGPEVALLFKSGGGADGNFVGVVTVPDREHGGIGGPGASMGCAHMLRPTGAAKAKRS